MGIPFHVIWLEWSAAEIALYQVYYKLAPWGEDRADIRNAMQMAQTANMHRDEEKTPEPYEINDFMPFREKDDEPDEPDVDEGIINAFTAMKR